MSFESKIQNIIDHFKNYDLGQNDDTSDASLLSNLSSYMYNNYLNVMITNEQYSKDIDNLQFNYPQINVMISYLTDLKPEYRKKCILLCYMFLKIRNINTDIVTPPDFSLDAGIDPKSGPSVSIPSITFPSIFSRSNSAPVTEAESAPVTEAESAPVPVPVPSVKPKPDRRGNIEVSCIIDGKEEALHKVMNDAEEKFAEFIIATKKDSIISEYTEREYFKPLIERAKQTHAKKPIDFENATTNLNDSLGKLDRVIVEQLTEELKPPRPTIRYAQNFFDSVTTEQKHIIGYFNDDSANPYKKVVDPFKDSPIIITRACKESDTGPEKEKELSDLLIIAGLLLLLDDDNFY